MTDSLVLTPSLLLSAYASGIFPMAESRDDPDVFWVAPDMRGIFPVGGIHISRSLRRRILKGDLTVRINTCFTQVVQACAARKETWINDTIFDLYDQLHGMGFAHSLEVFRGTRLVGGVYGVALGGAFFGESMFSRETDMSKVALAYLDDRLIQAGFTLFDTQFLTPHLASLGAVEVPKDDYMAILERALTIEADFTEPAVPAPQLLIQRKTQTS